QGQVNAQIQRSFPSEGAQGLWRLGTQLPAIGERCRPLTTGERQGKESIPNGARLYMLDNLASQGASATGTFVFELNGRKFHPGERSHWKTRSDGMSVLAHAGRIEASANQVR